MNLKRLCWVFTISTFVFSSFLHAQEDLPVAKPKVKKLAAFKNGLGFVFKSGDATLKNGWARMDELPAAALGSLWIGTTARTGPISDVIAYNQKVSENAEAITLPELLAANVGRRVALTWQSGNSPIRVEGTLLSVPADRKPDVPSLPFPGSPMYIPVHPTPDKQFGEIVLIRAGATDKSPILSVNKSLIQSIELLDGPNLNTKLEKELPRVKFHAAGNPKSAEITMSYLEKGIVWSPSYRVNIANDKTAEISLDAVLANDVEDLDDVEVSFVVGYPNFLYADSLTPLSLQQTVANFVQSLTSDTRASRGNRFDNIMAQSIAYNSANFDAGSRDALYSANQPMPGEASEDLYLYKRPGVTLKKGDRARYEVFTASVPYEHVYQWELADSMSVDDNGYRQNSGNRTEPETHIWHVLRLQNNTKQPWTTAPAFTLNGTSPIAQDVLGYAPSGGKSTLKLTVATGLLPESSQTELSRKPVNLEGYQFEEITVAGKLKVTSWEPAETCIVIHKSLTGEVLEAGSGKVTKVAHRLTAVNPNSEIEWEFHLPAGQSQEFTYQYKILVRR